MRSLVVRAFTIVYHLATRHIVPSDDRCAHILDDLTTGIDYFLYGRSDHFLNDCPADRETLLRGLHERHDG